MVRAVLIAALRFEIEKMAKSLIHDSPKVKRAQEYPCEEATVSANGDDWGRPLNTTRRS